MICCPALNAYSCVVTPQAVLTAPQYARAAVKCGNVLGRPCSRCRAYSSVCDTTRRSGTVRNVSDSSRAGMENGAIMSRGGCDPPPLQTMPMKAPGPPISSRPRKPMNRPNRRRAR